MNECMHAICALELKDVASWCGLVNTRILHLSLVLLACFLVLPHQPAYFDTYHSTRKRKLPTHLYHFPREWSTGKVTSRQQQHTKPSLRTPNKIYQKICTNFDASSATKTKIPNPTTQTNENARQNLRKNMHKLRRKFHNKNKNTKSNHSNKRERQTKSTEKHVQTST